METLLQALPADSGLVELARPSNPGGDDLAMVPGWFRHSHPPAPGKELEWDSPF